jgi:hypothetical protein
MFKIQMSKTDLPIGGRVSVICVLDSEFVSDFVLRISDFPG